ncbi:hypothetical protein AKH00_03495 [Microbacterium sp. GCS4]|nr:hypothetical protein AKH00_03495 [Microbacterium sp. GCS4]
MLIGIARCAHGRCGLARTMVVAVTVALGIIVGLLAMHTMNTHAAPSAHGGDVVVANAPAESHHERAAPAMTSADGHAADSADSADGASRPDRTEGHRMAWMACVLALLVGVLLLVRAAAWWRSPGRGSCVQRPLAWSAVSSRPLRPPSLTELRISRT